MKDKVAHERITNNQWELKRLNAEVKALQKDAEALREQIDDVRKIANKEPTMRIDPCRPFYMSLLITPRLAPMESIVRMILKHLNMEVHSISKGYRLEEIVDDKAKD